MPVGLALQLDPLAEQVGDGPGRRAHVEVFEFERPDRFVAEHHDVPLILLGGHDEKGAGLAVESVPEAGDPAQAVDDVGHREVADEKGDLLFTGPGGGNDVDPGQLGLGVPMTKEWILSAARRAETTAWITERGPLTGVDNRGIGAKCTPSTTTGAGTSTCITTPFVSTKPTGIDAAHVFSSQYGSTDLNPFNRPFFIASISAIEPNASA